MKVTVICVGRTRERFVQEGMGKYAGYLKHYADFSIKELKEEKIRDLKEAPLIRKREAQKILKAVPAASYTVALDERGEEFTSHEFASFLDKSIQSGIREIVFVFGGTLGLDEQVVATSQKSMALSRWTLTHEMARLVLMEQLYRAFTIITGKTYHY